MSTEDTEDLAELAAPENVEAYVEERREQEADAKPKAAEDAEVDKLTEDVRKKYGIEDETKKASRHERRKRAREMREQELEATKAENEQLRSQLDGRAPAQENYDPSKADDGALENSLAFAHDKHGDKFHEAFLAFKAHVPATQDQALYNKVMGAADVGEALIEWYEGHQQAAPQAPQDPLQEALEAGRQDTRFQTALAEREAQVRLETELQFRERDFAARYPDYFEQVQQLAEVKEFIPPTMLQLIQRSEVGPAIAYALSKDMYEGDGTIFNLESIANDPIAQAKLVGSWEQEYRQRLNYTPQRAATRAPAPIKPITGGSAPTDLHSLAKSDSAEAYIRARRGNG